MTSKELAQLLNGRKYRNEISTQECAAAKAAGLLVIFGYSDDNIELRGAVDDEIPAYEGTTIWFGKDGNLPDADQKDCPKCRKSIEAERKRSVAIRCLWCANGYSWFIRPDPDNAIPFEPFDIMREDDKFCRGIVIDTKDLPKI